MSVYLHAEIHVRPGHMADMLAMLETEIKPMMEAQGWKMLGCFQGLTGPRNVIVDLWELDDLEHFRRAYASLGQLAPTDTLRARLDSWVVRETLTFLDRRI